MERHEVLDAMSEIKLYGRLASIDEIAAKGLAQCDEIYPLIAGLIQAERLQHQARSVNYRISGVKFPALKGLDSFILADKPVDQGRPRELATGTFLDARRNINFIGGTGTGKTHLCIAIAAAVIRSRAPRQAFISHEARVIGQTLAVEMPFYIGGVGGAVAVVAAGGALAPAVAAMIAGGLVGGGLGALLATAIGRHHAAHIEAQLARGGIVLWVSVPNRNAEARALEILTKAGAAHVHVHDIEGDWTKRDVPFADAQPDPFLERDR